MQKKTKKTKEVNTNIPKPAISPPIISSIGLEDIDLTHQVLDEGEEAALRQMQENQHALSKIQSLLAPQTHPDFDGIHCIDCDNEIPKGRIADGRIRCVHCQSAIEHFEKQRRKN